MQWITINCVDFANIKFHSSNPWLHNVYVLTLSKESIPCRTQNTFLQNQNKSSCIYKYVTIHLLLGIKSWVCAMQTNTGLFDIIAVGFFFILSDLCRMKKICLSKKWWKQTGNHINQICSNIFTGDIWFITSYQMTLCGTKACSKRCFFPSKSSVFPFYLM